eukprot:TRINITY_DN3283_c0_g1_i1.p1 TRINITY_DN3283_c0_g1~~TRINITY_DN3283_c0_g1_i1.p1  ORF type:complete len:207 (-),score=37.26 TRINITY_DN3283_c0_g1_i1:219-839(-)
MKCFGGGKTPKGNKGTGVRVKPNNPPETKDYPAFKLLMIGDPGVGKSSLLLKYSENEFTDNFISTIGVDYKDKDIQLKDGGVAHIQIWDTAGQERFRTITSSYYRGANGIILTFDLTNPATFKSCKKWLQEVERYADEDVVVVLAGNKSDLEHKVSLNEITEFKQTQLANYVIDYFETSAKTGNGVAQVFQTLTEHVVDKFNGDTM